MLPPASSWRPSASMAQLRHRALSLQRIRAFFIARGYLEVDTPCLSSDGITDLYLTQLSTHCMGKRYYLQTSPEYYMKRLLAAGSGPIFQMTHVFRGEERGRWHQPEFTLLEWYQLQPTLSLLLEEVDLFLQTMLGCPALTQQTYQAAFEQHVGLDPHTASLAHLREALQAAQLHHVLPAEERDRDQFLFLLMSHVVEPALARLDRPVALLDFPVTQAALARIIDHRAARFEVYYRGVELANGFSELTDVAEQALRFEQERQQRSAHGLEACPVDQSFLEALTYGLPPCCGVALGVDRLIALAAGTERLDAVIPFAL